MRIITEKYTLDISLETAGKNYRIGPVDIYDGSTLKSLGRAPSFILENVLQSTAGGENLSKEIDSAIDSFLTKQEEMKRLISIGIKFNEIRGSVLELHEKLEHKDSPDDQNFFIGRDILHVISDIDAITKAIDEETCI